MSLLDKIKKESSSPTIKINPRKDELVPNVLSMPDVTNVLDMPDVPDVPDVPAPPQKSEENKKVSSDINKEQLSMITALKKELETLPTVVNKKMGVRLEENIYSEIRLFCEKNNITLETLLEAYFTICQDYPTLLKEVIENAQHRVHQRTKAGNIRSILTKTRNIQGNQ